MSVKTFTHNGGVWTRPDIPSSSAQVWKCHICGKDVESQSEQYQLQDGSLRTRFIPTSRYWHGYKVGVQYCSIECSFIDYEQQ